MTLTIKEAKTFEKLTKYAFKILESYNELIKLETSTDEKDHEIKRKKIIDKIIYYKLLEDEIYSEIKTDPKFIQKLIDGITNDYIKKQRNTIRFKDYYYEFSVYDNNLVSFRILEALKHIKDSIFSLDEDIVYNKYISFLLDEGVNSIDAHLYLKGIKTIIKRSVATRKAANLKHEADAMTNPENKKRLLSSFFREVYLNKYLENILLNSNFKRVPCILNQEISSSLIPQRISNGFIEYSILEDIKAFIQSITEEISIDLISIIYFKTLLLYLTPFGLDDIKTLIETTDFESHYLKRILLEEIKYADINKAYHNKDLNVKKEMN